MRTNTLCAVFVALALLAASPVFSAAPTTQASNLVASGIGPNQATLSWTNGDGAARIVLCNESSSSFPDPSNGVKYEDTNIFGNGSEIGTGTWVVMNRSASSVQILNLAPNTVYWVKVCEYNTPTSPEYLTSAATNNPISFRTLSASGSSITSWIRYDY